MEKQSAATRAKRRYNQKSYDALTVSVPKGKKDELKAAAAAAGYSSLSDLVKTAILNQLQNDGFLFDWSNQQEKK